MRSSLLIWASSFEFWCVPHSRATGCVSLEGRHVTARSTISADTSLSRDRDVQDPDGERHSGGPARDAPEGRAEPAHAAGALQQSRRRAAAVPRRRCLLCPQGAEGLDLLLGLRAQAGACTGIPRWLPELSRHVFRRNGTMTPWTPVGGCTCSLGRVSDSMPAAI